MERRRRIGWGIALVTALAVGALVGVQLADPFEGPRPPALEYDAPPGELAADALQQATARDHTVVWSIRAGNESAERVRLRVDATDRQALAVSNVTDVPWVTYASEYASWQGPAGALEPHYGSWADLRTLHAHTDHLRRERANLSVRTINESVVILRVADTDTATAVFTGREKVTDSDWGQEHRVRSNLTIVVDRATDAPTRVGYVTAEQRNGTTERRVSVRRYEWGPVDVTRPSAAGYTLREFVSDLADVDP